MANSSLSSILLLNDIKLVLDDWNGIGLPVVLQRNLTMRGPSPEPGTWPTLDMNFVRDKVYLAPNITITFQWCVVQNFRYLPHYQSPGWDLFTAIPDGSHSIVLTQEAAVVYRACLPDSLQSSNTSNIIPRPSWIPGTTRLSIHTPQPGCINVTQGAAADGEDGGVADGNAQPGVMDFPPLVPSMQRCWTDRGIYGDVATLGYDTNPAGFPRPNGYALHSVETAYLCPSIMPLDCVQSSGPTGCFYSLFVSNSTAHPPPSQPARHAPPSPVIATPLAVQGQGGGDSSVLGPVLGGVLGGVAGVALVAGVVLWLIRRRQSEKEQRQLAHKHATSEPQEAGDAEAGGPAGQQHYPGGGAPVGALASAVRITVQGASHEASRAQAAATPATPATEPAAAASIAFLPASVPTQSSAGPTDDIRFHAQLHVPGDAADSSIHTPTGGTRSAESGANDGAAIGAAIAGGLMHGAHASAVELAVVSAGDPAATAAVSTDTGLSEATAYTRHSGRTEGSGGELAAPHPAATIAVPVTPFTPHRGSLVMGVRCLDSGQLQQSQEVVAQRQGRQQQQQGGQPHAVGAQHAGVAGAPSCDGTTSGDCGTLTPIMTTITATAAALASSTSSMTAPLSGSTDAKPASAGPESGSGPASSGPGIAAAAVAAGRGGAAVEHTATCSSTSWLACSSTMSTAGASSTKQQHEDAALNSGGMQVSGAGGGGAAAAPTGTPGASPAPSSGSADDGLVVLTNVLLGKGSYGRVVEGRYGGQRVAVKLVAPALMSGLDAAGGGGGDGSGDGGSLVAQHRASFAQEVEVLGRCNHPNVVRLLAANLRPPRVCLVMELMDTSLAKLLHGRGTDRSGRGQLGQATDGGGGGGGAGERSLLPLDLVLYIARSVASALEYLHPTVVHRDLKPDNVLLSNLDGPRPVVKLSDFGIARLRATAAAITQNPEVGTSPYMSPECFDATNFVITHKADVYALGVLLWEMLAGEVPWHAASMFHIAYAVCVLGQRPPRSAIVPRERCPDKLWALISACWDTDPQRRPAAAEVVKELALVQLMLANPAAAAQPNTSTTSDPLTDRPTGAAAAAAAAGAAAAAAAARAGRLLGSVAVRGAGNAHAAMYCAPRPSSQPGSSLRSTGGGEGGGGGGGVELMSLELLPLWQPERRPFAAMAALLQPLRVRDVQHLPPPAAAATAVAAGAAGRAEGSRGGAAASAADPGVILRPVCGRRRRPDGANGGSGDADGGDVAGGGCVVLTHGGGAARTLSGTSIARLPMSFLESMTTRGASGWAAAPLPLAAAGAGAGGVPATAGGSALGMGMPVYMGLLWPELAGTADGSAATPRVGESSTGGALGLSSLGLGVDGGSEHGFAEGAAGEGVARAGGVGWDSGRHGGVRHGAADWRWLQQQLQQQRQRQEWMARMAGDEAAEGAPAASAVAQGV